LCLQVLANHRLVAAPRLYGHDIFPRNAMRKRGFCCRPVSDRLSVRHVGVLYPEGGRNVVKLLSRSGSSIILVFLTASADTQFQGEPFSGGGGAKTIGVRKI